MPDKKLTSEARETVQRLHNHLKVEIEHAGRGAARRVEDAVGLYRGYFRDKKRRDLLDIGVLFSALEELGVDRLAFVLNALAPPAEELPVEKSDSPTSLSGRVVSVASRSAACPVGKGEEVGRLERMADKMIDESVDRVE